MNKFSNTSEHVLVCEDGWRLHATLWSPLDTPKAAVLLHPATAVPEGLYFGFAQYLQEQGFAVLTYDYRGIGRSLPEGASHKSLNILMRDWAIYDVATATIWMRERYPDLPLLAVGHSFGGHAFGLTKESELLDGGVMVASHAGCLHYIPETFERLRATAALHYLAPVFVRAVGYFPGKIMGGEDLPGGVTTEWSGWTKKQRYFFDDPTLQAAERFSTKTFPILSLGMDDDLWATPPAIDFLTSFFTQAPLERRQISPKDVGASIGHMGFFRSKFRGNLWPIVSDWLHQRVDEL